MGQRKDNKIPPFPQRPPLSSRSRPNSTNRVLLRLNFRRLSFSRHTNANRTSSSSLRIMATPNSESPLVNSPVSSSKTSTRDKSTSTQRLLPKWNRLCHQSLCDMWPRPRCPSHPAATIHEVHKPSSRELFRSILQFEVLQKTNSKFMSVQSK